MEALIVVVVMALLMTVPALAERIVALHEQGALFRLARRSRDDGSPAL